MKNTIAIARDGSGIYHFRETDENVIMTYWKQDDTWPEPGDWVIKLHKGSFKTEVERGTTIFEMHLMIQYLNYSDKTYLDGDYLMAPVGI